MSKSIHLALSVFKHYLEKEGVNPSLPRGFIPQDISSELLSRAENIVLGTEKRTHNKSNFLRSLFGAIKLSENAPPQTEVYYYQAKVLAANAIFPQLNTHSDTDVATLWDEFTQALNAIPTSHQGNLGLWLDHFDTALQCFTTNIPSPYSDEISFYDFVKTVSAFVVALSVTENAEAPILLLQGDFFGIQDFIFSGGSQSNKCAAKLLRGRSFQVSLFTELAALKVLKACDLPATSQIMNAAGKFLIVAPNTQAVKNALKNTQSQLNKWFIKQTFGLVGLGLAQKAATLEQFKQEHYADLVKALFEQLEEQKLKRLDLLSTDSVQNVSYPNGVCEMNSYFPANDENQRAIVTNDQIKIGELLAKHKRIIICDENTRIYHDFKTQVLKLPLFGYQVIFTQSEKETGKFGLHIDQIHRFWDFSLPETQSEAIWKGYARRYINTYVPFKEDEQIKTFDEIASVDEGINALMTLKGDVDNLGTIFQKGIKPANIAKMATLSRQMNQFFSLWLPAYCAEHSQNMYTVFAGGDDFFLIGPWYSTQNVAFEMQKAFAHYVANNSEIHFSVGMVMSKVGLPVPRLGDLAEDALEKAKGIDSGKNAVTIFNRTVKWSDWHKLCELKAEIDRLADNYRISTSYLYSLIRLCEQAAKQNNIESTMWRSRFYYKTARYVIDKLEASCKDRALAEITTSIGKGIESYKLNFAIPLTNYFYQKR